MIPLLMLNHLIIKTMFEINPNLRNEQLSLAGQFLLPIGLLFVQFLIYDWLRGNYRR